MKEAQSKSSVELKDNLEMMELFGDFDRNLKKIKKQYDVKVYTQGMDVIVEGEEEKVSRAVELVKHLVHIIRNKLSLEPAYVDKMLEEERFSETVKIIPQIPTFQPYTKGQTKYVDAIEKNDIVLCVGPAGSGKTYLAVAMAVSFLKRDLVNRIILSRPAVEAGESLGFLPGTIAEKVNPYLIPLFDALSEILSFDKVKKLIERNVIEIAPLAFMRGRTLNNAFIILDEAQNTTYSQMKMFLTRMGRQSKVVVNGDITQIDLVEPAKSGFVKAIKILKNVVKGLEIVHLTEKDVLRHHMVQNIITAYESYESEGRNHIE